MTSSGPVRQLLRENQKDHSLPRPFYNDVTLYDLDLEAIWYRHWIFAGLECEIPNARDYLTLTIGRSPVAVIRNDAGEIGAFFNTCRHRGSKILSDRKGHLGGRLLVCPYHQWAYHLDGRLANASRMQPDFERDAYRLTPVAVRIVAGMIYVCLAEQPPDFAIYEAAIAPYVAPHGLRNAKIAHETDVLIHGNWKLFLENSRECYHCAVGHPELMRTFFGGYDFHDPVRDPTVADLWQRCDAAGLPSEQKHGPDFRLGRMPLANRMRSMTMDGAAAVSRRLGQVPEGDIGAMRWVHFPSATNNHIVGDYAILHRVLPIDAEKTLVTAIWLVDREAEEGRDYNLQALVDVWVRTNDQDRRLVERNQEGVNSMAYRPGPYSRLMEMGVISFVDWYGRTIEDYIETRTRADSHST